MSRELKLRGQCKANKEWVYGSLDWERDEDGYKRWYIHTGADGGLEEHYRVLPETVGQYTGLRDKNGKEIYEGDILRTSIGNLAITWTGHGFWLGQGQRFDGIEDVIKVIGSIHENPELLER